MSLILEALRKSEAERRRGQAPDLFAELPPAPRPRSAQWPAWSWLAAAAVLVAGVAWWVRGDAVHAPADTRRGAEAVLEAPGVRRVVDRAPALPAPQPAAATPAPRVPTAVQPASDAVVPSPITARPARMLPAPTAPAPAATQPAPSPAPPPPIAPPVLPPQGGVAMIPSLPADQRKALPPLKLTMHLWDETPAQRFVILDGQRLGEGGRIGELVVAAIEPEAVLFDWNGRKLRLPLR